MQSQTRLPDGQVLNFKFQILQLTSRHLSIQTYR